MTSEDGMSFVRSIAEAYQAAQQLPGLQARIRELEEGLVNDGAVIARLETRIIDLKNDQDALYSKLRSVEAERDDAGFRQLEAEDRADALRRTLQTVQGAVGEALKVTEPVTPLPTQPQTESLSNSSTGQEQKSSEPSISQSDTSHQSQAEAPVTGSISSNEASGERATDPTIESAKSVDGASPTLSVSTSGVGASATVATAEGQSVPLHYDWQP